MQNFNIETLKLGKKTAPARPPLPPQRKIGSDGFEDIPLYEEVAEPPRVNLNFPTHDDLIVFGNGFTLRSKELCTQV